MFRLQQYLQALRTSTDINPQHVYPEYSIRTDGLLCFNDGKSVRTCLKYYTENTRGIPTPMTTPLCRFDVVTLDILSFGKQCKNGIDSVVVFTDRLSKRAYISPCYKTSTAADLARIFFETVFRNQGMSRVLLSDNGPQFHSEFWTEFLHFSELRSY